MYSKFNNISFRLIYLFDKGGAPPFRDYRKLSPGPWPVPLFPCYQATRNGEFVAWSLTLSPDELQGRASTVETNGVLKLA